MTDANNGVGAAFDEVTQNVIVQNAVIGFPFYASPPIGNIPTACPQQGQQVTSCGSNLYYNQTTNNGTPQVNDVIRQGPTGNTSPLAQQGYYSFDCGPVNNPNTGTSRRLFQVNSSGVVIAVGFCGNPF